eukprot:6850349-Prymnesium_polylepis.4
MIFCAASRRRERRRGRGTRGGSLLPSHREPCAAVRSSAPLFNLPRVDVGVICQKPTLYAGPLRVCCCARRVWPSLRSRTLLRVIGMYTRVERVWGGGCCCVECCEPFVPCCTIRAARCVRSSRDDGRTGRAASRVRYRVALVGVLGVL